MKLLTEVEEYVKKKHSAYDSGHDWWHVQRVRKLAARINSTEQAADPELVDLTALLHDVVDSKFTEGSNSEAFKVIDDIINDMGLLKSRERIIEVINSISFSKRHITGKNNDPLLYVVQDADRLDAIGAIGVARAFNYGGFRNNPIFIPDGGPGSSTIAHFHDKLLILKGLMNTETGRAIAVERHRFLELFLEEFDREWNY